MVLYCRAASASTAPRTPRRTCCPHAYVSVTVLRVSNSCEMRVRSRRRRLCDRETVSCRGTSLKIRVSQYESGNTSGDPTPCRMTGVLKRVVSPERNSSVNTRVDVLPDVSRVDRIAGSGDGDAVSEPCGGAEAAHENVNICHLLVRNPSTFSIIFSIVVHPQTLIT